MRTIERRFATSFSGCPFAAPIRESHGWSALGRPGAWAHGSGASDSTVPTSEHFYGYPSSLHVDSAIQEIRCTSPDAVDTLIREKIGGLKVTTFESPEAWFAYFGDPEQQPSWFTYVALAVEAAVSAEEARAEIEQHEEKVLDGGNRGSPTVAD